MAQEFQNNCFIQIETEAARDPVNLTIPFAGLLGNRLVFTNMPAELGTNKSANINRTEILGRSEPIKTYGSSSERAWNVDLHFFADENAQNDVVRKVNWCESLVYPIYKDGISLGIPLLTFVFGTYLNVKAICTSVQTSIPGPWEVLDSNAIGLPLYAICTLTLEQVADTPFGHIDVKRGRHNLGGNG